ncbi:Deoxyguanosinetriphosphate triphosphohydrolase-like protein [Dissostichus eleginoides]|uniref:Deoxyguanosinetriphosphate triphosphohydrolase-like protein n=1 Tax=Dissostichus eleginoides TaxID=100907 RepID=A0AAD9BB97_DISEL|nr:Deoxyguanosinetriphosphate triphosphohydrolase-like protein [Dissostichus eleginoides]
MLWRLLGLLLLPSLHSAMHMHNSNKSEGPRLRMLDPADMNMTEWDFGTPHLTMPNMTSMPGGAVNSPTMPDPTICSILMSMPDIPLDQIPPSCLCSHCKGITGPKGTKGTGASR